MQNRWYDSIHVLGEALAGNFDSTAWNQFSSHGSSTYRDDKVFCARDSGDRPVCQLSAETTSAARRAGSIAAMQQATDAFLNLVPSFNENGIKIKLDDGTTYTPPSSKDVLLNTGGGYDGQVGPATQGQVMLALSIAGSLDSITTGDATPAFLADSAGVVAYFSDDIASYLRDIVNRFWILIAAYKAKAALSDLPPSPMLIPAALPKVAAALVAQQPQRKKFPTAFAVAGTVTGAALLAGLLAYNSSNKPGEQEQANFPPVAGAGWGRRRGHGRRR